MDFDILFEQHKGIEQVVGYVDVNYASDLDRKRSTTRYLFTLVSEPISWKAML